MRVLIYGNRKQDDDIYDISTPEKEAAAYLRLFNYLNEDWQVYDDLRDVEELVVCEPCGKEIHRLCEGECACEKTEECKKKSARSNSEQRRVVSMKHLYDLAKTGDAAAAYRLLNGRKDNEYEGFVIDPD
jgi:hypothetical protein